MKPKFLLLIFASVLIVACSQTEMLRMRVDGLVLSFWRLSTIPLRLSFAIKVCIFRRSSRLERLSTKAVSDGLFTIGFLPSFRLLFNSLIFLI